MSISNEFGGAATLKDNRLREMLSDAGKTLENAVNKLPINEDDVTKDVKRPEIRLLVDLEPPKIKVRNSMIATLMEALSMLSEITTKSAENTKLQLGQKKEELRNLLEKKLADTAEQAEKYQDMLKKMEEAAKRESERSGFSRAFGFVMGALTAIGGVFTVAAGIVSGQPSLIAGGSLLIASGTCDILAETCSLAGNEKAADTFRKVAIGCLVAGVICASYGAATAASGALAAGKQGLTQGVKQGASHASKQAAQQAAKKTATELSEKAIKNISDDIARGIGNRMIRASAQESIEKATKEAMSTLVKKGATETTEASARELGKQVAKEAAEKGVERTARINAELAAKDVAVQAQKEAFKKVAKEAADEGAARTLKAAKAAEDLAQAKKYTEATKVLKKGATTYVVGAGVARTANAAYQGYMDMERAEYERRVNELEKEISDLQAHIVKTQAIQENINKLMDLLLEYLSLGIMEPYHKAGEKLGEIIRDTGQVFQRMALTHAV